MPTKTAGLSPGGFFIPACKSLLERFPVMAGLVPAIHAFFFLLPVKGDVDARHKAGHDGREAAQLNWNPR